MRFSRGKKKKSKEIFHKNKLMEQKNNERTDRKTILWGGKKGLFGFKIERSTNKSMK